jgi:Holliday junction resolvasome RuvABC DNA-binding subunit
VESVPEATLEVVPEVTLEVVHEVVTPPLPEGEAARILHLSAYKGVGKKTAESLVQALGDDLYRVLENDPDRVRALLPGARAEKVLEAWASDPLRSAGARAGA